jgi:DNA-binding NarL/FixJ family response regulator
MHVLIANDFAAVRSGISGLLRDALPGTTFAEAGDREQTLSLLATQTFSIVLLDIKINTPGSNGLDLLRAINALYPGLPVVLLGIQPENQYAQPCIRAGAAGYINLDNAPERLAQEVARVLARERNG